jgi:hypothetical protein
LRISFSSLLNNLSRYSFRVGGSPANADQLSTIIRLWEETFDRMK